MNPRHLVKLKGSDLAKIRDAEIAKGALCPILGIRLTKENAVVDHKHITKRDIKEGKTGQEGKGLLRGVINDQANVFLGKIEKGWVRSGCHKLGPSISDQLRAAAAFLEKPPLEQKYIHPSEREKKDTLTRTEYERVCKYYFILFPKKKVLPKWPKTGKSKNPNKPNKPIKTTKWIRLLHLVEEYRAPASRKNVQRVSTSPKVKTLKRVKCQEP